MMPVSMSILVMIVIFAIFIVIFMLVRIAFGRMADAANRRFNDALGNGEVRGGAFPPKVK